ncbi:uncharacterized protein PG998_012432 [Apiospora kogelbergensis]|uniref:uncharacterized protein n=1 Tax=Apiospora kogelbergensis TaxID=1337665 RepID=UPI003131D788
MTESDKYECLEKIGHGSFGVIRKVRRKTDGMVLCRKEISYLKMSQKEREQLHAEFQILSSLRHPNIVGYYHREHLKISQDLHLYMEYCGNGDLGRVIRELTQQNKYAEEAFVSLRHRPPDVGKHVLGLGATAKPKLPPGGMTILHRDLKPENVFLGEDNSVKLGDFGLSKVMQSHDFASTYVGTPFYMSPEICAAERYTLKSDIWSLGCIMYELCTKEPPFNAKSHFQLVQKIKEGKIAPLPSIYSAELMGVIRDCLKTNPDRRPDTAALLNMPVVRLMRKEREIVEMGKLVKIKEDVLERKLKEAERKLENEKAFARQEIENSLRREWEVKARLEIDRLVSEEMEQLRQRFEAESQEFTSSSKSDYPHSIGGASTDLDGEFPSTTDITELSIDSPEPAPPKKTNRTPFGRAQTMFAGPLGTPMDIEMASPSPIPLAALSLSPRRNAATKVPSSNVPAIFAEADNEKYRDVDPVLSESEDDDEPLAPSPTRNPGGFTINKPIAALGGTSSIPELQPKPSNGALRDRIPSAANLSSLNNGENGLLQRKNSLKDQQQSESALSKVTAKNNLKGRTLVELQQARAGGRGLENGNNMNMNISPKRAFKDRIGNRSQDSVLDPPAIWDPERDDMPSPFLVRRKNIVRV